MRSSIIVLSIIVSIATSYGTPSLVNLCIEYIAQNVHKQTRIQENIKKLPDELQKLFIFYEGPSEATHFASFSQSVWPVTCIGSNIQDCVFGIGHENGEIYIIDVSKQRIDLLGKTPNVPHILDIQNKIVVTQALLQPPTCWNVKTGKCISFNDSIQNHHHRVKKDATFIGFESQLLLKTNEAHEVIISPLFSTKQKIFHGHTEKIISISFTKNTQYFASLSQDKTIRIWNMLTQWCEHIVRIPVDIATTLSAETNFYLHIDDETNFVALGMQHGKIHIWQLKTHGTAFNSHLSVNPLKT